MTSPLITPTDLAALLGSGVVLLDVRWRLGAPDGRPAYRQAHLPGAVYVDLDRELAAPPSAAGRHPLPAVGDLQAAARSWGVRRGDPVVAYDDTGGTAAARAWWLLRWAGLGDVRVLDGGLPAWRAAALPVETGERTAEPGDVVLTGGALPVVDADAIASFDGTLLDARAAERYRGEVEPVDPRAGHIPGAISAPSTANLDADGRFLAPELLRARFADLGAAGERPVAVYCGSGVTAAHGVLALTVAGLPGAALYPGSWSEWSGRPDAPVATGSQP